MRNKHIHIESDSSLLSEIRRRVNEELNVNHRTFRLTFVFKFIVYLVASVVFYCALFFNLSTGHFVLSFILLGLSLLLLAFNFAHDFSHNTVFSSKRWNNLGYIGIYTLVGAHAEAWKERHVGSHHFAPNVKEYDSDLQITNLIRVTPEMEHKWFHRFQFIYAPIAYSSYSLYWIFIKDFILLRQKMMKENVSSGYAFSFIGQKTFYLLYLLILPLLFSHQEPQMVILGFVLMHLVQSIFLLFTFFMTHHVLATSYPETDDNGVIQASWLMNQVRSSNDMHPFSRLANFVLGGFNNHIAHHLFPHIHHIHYPRLSEILYQVLIENGVTPNQTSYIGGAMSHLKLLKRLSKKRRTAEMA